MARNERRGICTDGVCIEKTSCKAEEIDTKVFRAYLKERREEMIPAFQNAPISGKCLGLELLGEEAEQNKAIILGFGPDSSKAVRKSLLDILCEKRDWEKEILALLGSRKGAERELAVQVLSKWDSEGYKPVLTRALEKGKNRKVRALLETVLQIPGDCR